jgi:tryptophan synthase alpha chain
MPTRSSATTSGTVRTLHADAKAAGVDGVLVVDYPPEECEAFAAQLKACRHGPDLPAGAHVHRRAHAEDGRIASGYVYYVSLKGVTGAGHLDTDAVAAMLPRIRAHVKRAGGRGFRHPRRRHREGGGAVADAVVIGSRLVQLLERRRAILSPPLPRAFMAEIRAALDAGLNEGVSA